MSAPTAPLERYRLRRMVGRDPEQRHRSVSPLELLYDLTFVVAFAQAGDQLAHLVAEGHVGSAVTAFVFILAAVCWAWINYSWFASAFDTDDWFHRVLTMVQMVGVVILALGIPDVFHSIDAGEPIDNRVVVIGYVVMRVSMVAMWLRVALQDPPNRRTALLYMAFTAGAQLGWVVVAFAADVEGLVLIALIIGLWVIELLGPVIATWDGQRGDDWQGTPWHPHHIAERYGLLVIITLGEVILGTVAAVAVLVDHGDWSTEAVQIVVAGVGIALGLWWTYFLFPSGQVLARHRNRKWAWSYGHIVVFGSLAAVGAGLHVAAYAAEGITHIGTVGVVLSVAVPVFIFGVAYFVLWSILFRAVDRFHVMLFVGMVAVLVLSVVAAGAGWAVGWCLLIVMASTAVVPVGYETGGWRHVEADLQREA